MPSSKKRAKEPTLSTVENIAFALKFAGREGREAILRKVVEQYGEGFAKSLAAQIPERPS